MEKRKYVIIKSANLDELEERVNDQIRLGYKPFWNLYVATEGSFLPNYNFVQCMIEDSLSDIKVEEIGDIKKGAIVSTNAWSVEVSGAITVNE